MSICTEISEKLQKGRSKEVAALVGQALNEGIGADVILNDGLISGMNDIGEKFKTNSVFIPEILVAAKAMKTGLGILKPYLAAEGANPIGKAVICTIKGDMHDIGKNLVRIMMEGQGIECIDLGVDVGADRIVEAIKESGAEILCLSSLLTTTMGGMKDIIETLKDAGIRDSVRVLVGGAPISQAFADEIGADVYTTDAASAASAAKEILLG